MVGVRYEDYTNYFIIKRSSDILDDFWDYKKFHFGIQVFTLVSTKQFRNCSSEGRRKSSCVNARGIPTAAYQVLPEVGYPPWARSDEGGTWGGVPPSRGTPQPGPMGGTQGGVTPLARSDGGVPKVGYPLAKTPLAGGTPHPPAGPGRDTP